MAGPDDYLLQDFKLLRGEIEQVTARDTFAGLWELETLVFDRQAALAKLCRITQSDANLGCCRCGGIPLLLINQGAPVPRPVS
jgi:hypothetical protein